MDSVSILLLAVAGIFLLGALGEIVFEKTSVPDAVWLIVAGILLGPVSGLVTQAHLATIAPFFGAVTLIVVLFDGGTQLNLSEVSRAAPRSGVLATATFLGSIGGVALLSRLGAVAGVLPKEWTWAHCVMTGAILGGSSPIIVANALARAKVAPRVSALLNLESALTDAVCVVVTGAAIDILRSGSAGPAAAAWGLVRSFGLGIIVGGFAGLGWLTLLRLLRASEHAYPFTLAALLLLYVGVSRMGGSSLLGILAFALVVGNAPTISQRLGLGQLELEGTLRGTHAQIAFIVKSFFFTFIGLMLGPPWKLIGLGIVIGAVLLGVRVVFSRIALLGSDLGLADRRMVAIALPRGMAAGVLATLPAYAGVPNTESLPVMVFAAIFTSILLFTAGFAWVRRGGAAAPAALPATGAVPPTNS